MANIRNSFLHGVFSLFAPGDPAKALQKLIPQLRWLCLAGIESPSHDQILVVRRFDPYKNVSIVAVRDAIKCGTVRLGPLKKNAAKFIGDSAFRVHGFSYTLRAPTEIELREIGIVPP
jgi:hypothetical protein